MATGARLRVDSRVRNGSRRSGPTAQPMFTAHMWAHLLVGMVAPLFLVVARPVTLALRTLRQGPARRTVLAVAHSRYAAVVMAPPVAAVIDMGGL